MTPKIMEVMWIDSYGIDDSWHHLGEPPSDRILRTVGFVVEESDSYTVIASTWDTDTHMYGTATAVLNRCILVKNEISE